MRSQAFAARALDLGLGCRHAVAIAAACGLRERRLVRASGTVGFARPVIAGGEVVLEQEFDRGAHLSTPALRRRRSWRS